MPQIKKIESKEPKVEVIKEDVVSDAVSEGGKDEGVRKVTKRGCFYCDKNMEPTYTDSSTLKRFMSDRARIYGADKSNLCAKHQRRVAKEIKHARHLAILPFVPAL